MATDLFAQRQLVVASLDPTAGNIDGSNIQLLVNGNVVIDC